ncbi:hypothetical protein ACIQAC_10000 [Streptomyces sp. NPDC088387]|uniref:SCO2400 family protein n=1 Tax=Streptomyces sp. NPDC088387 TaxID=3365859 RepID=UPI0038095F23
MDYCSSCRRHLNGVFVCPGCGAYAPDIAPPSSAGQPLMPPRNDTAWATAPVSAPVPPELDAPQADFTDTAAFADIASFDDTATHADPAAVGDTATVPSTAPAPVSPAPVTPVASDTAGTETADPLPVLSHGRASRRRQLARLKKSQRRAVIATAFALVGGGLTLSTMERGSGDRAQAATAPDTSGMGGTDEEVVDPTLPDTPRTDDGRTSRTAPPRSADPAEPSTPGIPRQRTADTSESVSDTRTGTQGGGQPTSVNTLPESQSAAPPASPPDSAGGSTPPPTSATPTPTPTPSDPPAGGTEPADPSADQLCLLVICVG